MTASPYYDLGRLRAVIGLALLAMAALELAYGVSSWQYLQLARDAAGLSDAEFDTRWTAYQALETPVITAYGIATLACYASGAAWTLAAARNAARLLPDPRRISPGGALGWYIVPIAGMIMPFRAMRQILNSSTRPVRELNAPAPRLLVWWWGVWMVSSALVLLSMLLPADPETDMVPKAAFLDVINTPLAVVAIWLWWQVVTLVTHLQKAARPTAPTNSAQEVIQ